MGPLDFGHWPNRIRFGPGAITQLSELMVEMGVGRAAVICGGTVAGGEMLARVKAALGGACAGIFADVAAQTPLPVVRRGAAAVAAMKADVVVSVGGGSAIDAAKCIALLRACGGDFAPYLIAHGDRGSMARAALGQGVMAHIAVPTTAGSSSEVLPTAGCRDPDAGSKLLFWDRRLVPGGVVLDPELAVHAGPELTAATGMTAMARCIEALYSAHRQPLSTGLALHAARLLRTALPISVAEPGNLAARSDCLMASLMSGTASINAMVSVVHAIGHIVGGRYGLQHGTSHAVLLAPAMRLLLPAIGDDQFAVLEAMGGAGGGASADAAGAAAAEAMAALVAALPLRPRLRDLGVARGDLGALADAAMDDYMMAAAPRPLDVAEVAALLESVW